MITDITAIPVSQANYIHLNGTSTVCHPSYDFLYIIAGQITITCNDISTLYKESMVRMINPDTEYTTYCSKNNTIILLSLKASFVQRNLGSLRKIFCDSALEPANSYLCIKRLITQITNLCLEGGDDNYLLLLGLLYHLLNELRQNSIPGYNLEQEVPEKYQTRVYQIVSYINQNYQEKITLGDLSKELALSPQYLSKFFNKYMHTNFKQFLLEKRLAHAWRQICYTDDSITEISIQSGFSDVSSFSRAFRLRFKKNPTSFRHHKQKELNEKDYNDYAINEIIPKPDQRSLAIKQKILIDVVNYSDINARISEVFNLEISSLLNISYARNLLDTRFCNDLVKTRKILNIRSLRLLGLVSNALIPRVLPDYNYYFLDVDRILEFMRQNMFTPFIELTRLPYIYTADNSIGTMSFIPRNQRFLNLLEEFLKHVLDRYPKEWTSKWEFEVWKTPRETNLQYVTSLAKVCALIRRYIPNAKIGGPGFDSARDLNELKNLLITMGRQHIKLDFVSSYLNLLMQTDKEKDLYMISLEKNNLQLKASAISSLIRKYMSSSAFYITEWTSVPIVYQNSPIQTSCYQAAFICHSALSVKPYCDKMGYWTFKDSLSPESIRFAGNSPVYFWGRGLINESSVPVPAYYAFMILNRLGNKLIKSGSNYCATQKEPGNYQILVFNYAHFEHCPVLEADIASKFYEIYKFFHKNEIFDFIVKLNGLIPGIYRVTRILLNRLNGSRLDLIISGFLEGNIPLPDYLMQTRTISSESQDLQLRGCIPEERIIYIKTEGSLTLDAHLSPHTVCLWEIKLLA